MAQPPMVNAHHQMVRGPYARLLFRLQRSDQWFDLRRQGLIVKYGLVFLEAPLLAFLQGLQRSFVVEQVPIAKQPRGVHAQMAIPRLCAIGRSSPQTLDLGCELRGGLQMVHQDVEQFPNLRVGPKDFPFLLLEGLFIKSRLPIVLCSKAH